MAVNETRSQNYLKTPIHNYGLRERDLAATLFNLRRINENIQRVAADTARARKLADVVMEECEQIAKIPLKDRINVMEFVINSCKNNNTLKFEVMEKLKEIDGVRFSYCKEVGLLSDCSREIIVKSKLNMGISSEKEQYLNIITRVSNLSKIGMDLSLSLLKLESAGQGISEISSDYIGAKLYRIFKILPKFDDFIDNITSDDENLDSMIQLQDAINQLETEPDNCCVSSIKEKNEDSCLFDHSVFLYRWKVVEMNMLNNTKAIQLELIRESNDSDNMINICC